MAARPGRSRRRLPDGFVGSTKNNPIPLPDGSLLHPSSTEDAGWRLHFERSDSGATKWEKIGPIHDGKDFGAIQPPAHSPRRQAPGAVPHPPEADRRAWSADGGKTVEQLAATALPNPNSGIAALTLADGRTCSSTTTRRRAAAR